MSVVTANPLVSMPASWSNDSLQPMEKPSQNLSVAGILPEFLARRVSEQDRAYGTPCLEWSGALHLGYAWVWFEGQPQLGHRLAYEHAIGPIPEDLVIDHLCRNRCCINPLHLEPVPHAVNIRRAHPNYTTDDMTVCPNGHPLTEGWVYRKKNTRVCVRCTLGEHARPYRGPIAERTTCPQGHAYAGDNLYITPGGSKVCRRCRADKERERKLRKAA